MVVFDSSFLLALLDATTALPPDPRTKKPVEKARERLEHLLDTLSEAKVRVLIPAPVLAEVLVYGGTASAAYLQKLRSESAFVVGDFDTLAAAECAQLHNAAIGSGNKRGSVGDAWQKVKVDRQIISIAKVRQATTLYTADQSLAKLAKAEGFTVLGVADLKVPPMKNQDDMFADGGK